MKKNTRLLGGSFANKSDDGSRSFFAFLNSFRWLNWVLALVLLYFKATPKMPASTTAIVYGAVFVYNCAFTFWPARVEKTLRKYPFLLLADITFCSALMWVYGWQSPFTVYSFSPVMLAGYLFKVPGSFVAAALSSIGYGVGAEIQGYSWAKITAMGMVDLHLFQYFDYFLIAVFFSYPAVLADKLRRSNQELVKAQAEIERLVVSKERKRLAGDMHDNVTQSLLGVGLLLEAAMREVGDNPKLAERLILAKESATQALDNMRSAIDDLFEEHLSSQCLTELVAKKAAEVERSHNIPIDFCVRGQAVQIPTPAKKAIYLIVQEALSNALKHAAARQINIELAYSTGELKVEINDDGNGFETGRESGGHGLKSMKTRANQMNAELEVDSAPSTGTRIIMRAPLTPV